MYQFWLCEIPSQIIDEKEAQMYRTQYRNPDQPGRKLMYKKEAKSLL